MGETHQLHVLWIGSDPPSGRALEERLGQLGHAVTLITRGEDGPAACDEGRFDVVVLDGAPEGMSGLEVLRALTERDSAPPTVMVIEPGEEDVAVEAMKIGAAGHVVKDVRGRYVDLLPGTLERAFEYRRLREDRARADYSRGESEERFKQLAGASWEAIVVHEDGVVLEANEQYFEMFGYEPEELTGREGISRTTTPESSEIIRRQMLAGNLGPYRATGKRKDGTEFPMELRVRMIDYQGRSSRVAAIRDLSDQERAQEERLRLERQLLHSQKLESLGVLAGGIAHDFNNILVAVLGHAGLALEVLPESHQATSSVREIEKGARRAAELTRQMLAYSGQGHFVIETLDLSALVDDMAHLFRTSVPRKIALSSNLERSLPQIEADAAQMQQVVMNLLTNASEAIGDDSGVVTLSTGPCECTAEYLARSLVPRASPDEISPPGRYVYLEVSDTGCGIDEAARARLFDPFFTTKFTGRGLGMAAVLGIVRGHRGGHHARHRARPRHDLPRALPRRRSGKRGRRRVIAARRGLRRQGAGGLHPEAFRHGGAEGEARRTGGIPLSGVLEPVPPASVSIGGAGWANGPRGGSLSTARSTS
jgi:PAS domain S-box-containing protein